jgi:hypothetical protein
VQGVGHDPKSLPDVRRTDARSAKIGREAGVVLTFQVSLNKVEPSESISARNLLAVDAPRAALADEVEPCRPEVPLVSKPSSFACRAERLARTGTSPNRSVSPVGHVERVVPNADSGKEVTAVECSKVIWANVLN